MARATKPSSVTLILWVSKLFIGFHYVKLQGDLFDTHEDVDLYSVLPLHSDTKFPYYCHSYTY